jgi:hypothetical protein
MVLNRRLPRITARDLLPIAPFRGHFPSCPDNLTRVETFAGARLARFPVMRSRRDKYREVFQVRPKAALPDVASGSLDDQAKSGSPPGIGH